ncbi:beta-ketoacyl synthase N-terminal-like domain-containing protein [Xenorhabdus entomophaga]|uniref:beta-ketoacyl synthase N-terminal-like domain-containing protein n=1 Tax=Xenorhabdus entomophaga TaxID=3136257 RepID=UPI0030F3F452
MHNIIRLNDSTFAAVRIASTLGLQGPAISVQSACSSSLSAIHVGCQSILSGESEMALVGACSLLLPQHRRFTCRDGDILAHDGICRPLDITATGTVASSGGAVFLLKPAQSAIKSGNKIYAVIKATSLNNDGGGKSSFGAPSVFGQKTVIEEGLSVANINASQLSYHELHGTATLLGDLIEMESTSSAFNLSMTDSITLGAIKSQIGHTDAASGMFGIINTIYSLVHRCVPPITNFKQLNPNLTPFIVGFSNPQQQSQLGDAEMLFGSTSSFGIGGTNGFAVLAVNNMCSGWCEPYPEHYWENEQECYITLMPTKQITRTLLQTEDTEQLTNLDILNILEKLLDEKITDTTLSFYDIGGDSIILLDFIDIIKKRTRVSLPLNELISYPIINDLIRYTLQMINQVESITINKTESFSSMDRKLNDQQKNLWLYSKMHPHSDAMNIANLFEINSCITELDIKKNVRNWIKNHPVLNCQIKEFYQQLVWQPDQSDIDIVMYPKASKAVAIGRMKNILLTPISIEGKLSRFALHEIDGGWLIGLSIHHAIIDGIHLGSLIKTLSESFNS